MVREALGGDACLDQYRFLHALRSAPAAELGRYAVKAKDSDGLIPVF